MKRLKVIQIGGEHDHAVPVLDSLRRQNDLFDVIGYVIPEDDTREQVDESSKVYAGLPRLTLGEAFAVPGLQGAVIETSEKKLTKYARIAAYQIAVLVVIAHDADVRAARKYRLCHARRAPQKRQKSRQ